MQLDSINTVARAHDLILFARRPRYRPKALERLYTRDRALFEHWTHDAAVIPMEFYPHWHMRRTRDAERLKKAWSKDRRAGFEAQYQTVLDHIRDHGACSSSDVGTADQVDGGTGTRPRPRWNTCGGLARWLSPDAAGSRNAMT